MERQFKAPDGRSYFLTKELEVEKIDGLPVTEADRKRLIRLGFTVINKIKKIKKEKEVNNAY